MVILRDIFLKIVLLLLFFTMWNLVNGVDSWNLTLVVEGIVLFEGISLDI